MTKLIKYYYCHPESGALWSSINPPECEPEGDGLVMHITKAQARRLMKEWDIRRIKYYALKQNSDKPVYDKYMTDEIDEYLNDDNKTTNK